MCENLGFVQPHINHFVHFLAPQYKKQMQLLESIQVRAVKMMKDPKEKMSEEQLKVFGLLSPEQRSWREALWWLRRAALSSALCDSNRAWGNGMELSGEGQLGVRGRAVGTAPSAVVQGSVWTTLSNTGFEFWVVLCAASSWTWRALYITSNSGYSMILW